jgi:hypothetical protein
MLAFAFLLFLQSQSAAQTPHRLVCGDRDAHTPALRSRTGHEVVLTMHSEDDHSKDTHLCETTYLLHVVHPDGSRSAVPGDSGFLGFWTNDDDWNRPVVFHVDGFSGDGTHVFALISEGGRHPGIDAFDFDMKTGALPKFEGADGHFLHALGAACASTLRVAGLSHTGHIVLETTERDGCARAERWELSANRKVSRSALSGTVPGIPHRLPSGTQIIVLDPGLPSKPTD